MHLDSSPSSLQPPTLRPYQLHLIKELYTTLGRGHRRVAIIAGTGAGKTVIGGKICADAEARGLKLLFLVHLDVLVGQTYEKMKSFGLHCGFIKSGWREDLDAPIQIASIQTMAKRNWWQQWPANVVFFDEGHTTVFSQIGQQVMYETHPSAVHLAMTATPYRLGRSQLGDHMETFVASPVPAELQQMGFLASMKYYGLPTENQVDLEGVRTVAGDYDERDLKNACDRPELVQRIVEEWHRLTPNKRTIAFCVDVDHARHVAEAFKAAGVPSAAVDGSTAIKARQRLYAELRAGTILVLTSCNVISIGFDEPSVEVGLLLRPTQSRALHQQQIGRVMRISPATGKIHGIILDQAGNLPRLGFPEDVKEYRLPTSKEPDASETPPNKQCPDCNRFVWGFVLECPDCGYSWQTEPQVHTEAMVEVVSEEILRRLEEQKRIEFFRMQRRKTFLQGAAPNWTKRVFFERFNCLPDKAWSQNAIFGETPTRADKVAYKHYLATIAQQQGKALSWVIDEFQQEFGSDHWQDILLNPS
ncbi:DEAD/DEAH box helicase family protein [Oculatella sp. LEGE 06141]|uniref:DEAD/DEAH box helicase n=1 Tax=Oculatella sp. LEGE 06141 TaxID=1828648 RepID=UPI00188043F0|nr:DEAD/DEAH box helicase [Oculatella sp. LEGE 06141]MBE9177703.1 DEAD/DEAH box helicase family protein [Oculatella sp. LEGE 06141]